MSLLMQVIVGVAVVLATTEAFFLRWGTDSSRQVANQKSWIQPVPQSIPHQLPGYRYSYSYNPYEQRKYYQVAQQYQHEPIQPVAQSMAPIPISVPAGASLQPISLQHVQLVPCMCPVAPEEAEKLQESVGPGPYLAQSYQQQNQQNSVSTDTQKKVV